MNDKVKFKVYRLVKCTVLFHDWSLHNWYEVDMFDMQYFIYLHKPHEKLLTCWMKHNLNVTAHSATFDKA